MKLVKDIAGSTAMGYVKAVIGGLYTVAVRIIQATIAVHFAAWILHNQYGIATMSWRNSAILALCLTWICGALVIEQLTSVIARKR